MLFNNEVILCVLFGKSAERVQFIIIEVNISKKKKIGLIGSACQYAVFTDAFIIKSEGRRNLLKQTSWGGSIMNSQVQSIPNLQEFKKIIKQPISRPLYSKQTIEERIDTKTKLIAGDLNRFKTNKLTTITVLKGATLFAAKSIKMIQHHLKTINPKFPLNNIEKDRIQMSSYGESTISSGKARIIKDLKTDIEGRTVLIFEDIIHTGTTMYDLVEWIKLKKPKKILVFSLIHRNNSNSILNIVDKYWCCIYTTSNEYFVGYGMDYKEQWRWLNNIYSIKKEFCD